MLAPRARDALFHLRRIPRQVAIDNDAGVLQVQFGAAAVSAEEDSAIEIIFERVDFRATTALRNATGVPGETETQPVAKFSDEFQHPLPFGEDDDFRVVLPAFIENFSQFAELGANAIFRIEYVIRVANHPQHRQFALQFFLFLFRERTALGGVHQPGIFAFAIRVITFLPVAQRHEMIAIGAFGQFRFHIHFASAQHVRFDAGVKLIEVAKAAGPSALIQFLEVAVESEQRSQHRRIEKIHQRMQFVDAVFDGRAGEDKRVTAAQALEGLGGFGVPVFDALGLIEHHNVWPQTRVDLQPIDQHLFIIHQSEERRVGVFFEPFMARFENKLIGQIGEALNLFLPFRLQRRRRYNEHLTRLAKPMQQRARRDGLNGFAQAHFVREQRAFGESEVEHPFALIGKERHFRFVHGPFAALHFEFVFVAQFFAFDHAKTIFQLG